MIEVTGALIDLGLVVLKFLFKVLVKDKISEGDDDSKPHQGGKCSEVEGEIEKNGDKEDKE